MNKIAVYILLFFFISSSLTVVFNSVSATELFADSWNTKTPMKQARYGLGVVAVDSKIYAIGGFATDGSVVSVNERYDPNADVWITLESMPTPRAWFAITACQGKIYCVGGTIYDKMERVTFRVNEVYDTVTDSWSTKASLPYKGTNVQANAMDDKIFVIIDGKDLYMYDPVTDLWTKKSDLPETPTGGSLFVSIVVDGKIIRNSLKFTYRIVD